MAVLQTAATVALKEGQGVGANDPPAKGEAGPASRALALDCHGHKITYEGDIALNTGSDTRRLRLGIALLAPLALAIAGFGPPQQSRAASSHRAGASRQITKVAYQLHMVFFSHEAGLSTIIDPQMFVSAPGTPAGTGPQGIYHVANIMPAPAADAPDTALYNADGQDLGVALGEWEAAQGRGALRCRGGVETVTSHFHHLLAHGVYSLFVVHFLVQGSGRFTPLGAPDGSTNSFVANPD